ncbi:sigma-54-dependent Fis family transcriptional regulator [Thalassotalea sp. HSM 43]|uniref:sigma-54 interaction domain-containing protein n=1 Tax=Thalassotalea sp. HSM 43 TaxID=2552945 RepID=UPI001082196F|nr:sigma-54 dependent transcriptional regulator [Thalassotalea sp. HSM 43]QBY03476.1 sigma-54-dependent Fis family transcriptional regulator [Thalassotalea sp. HSM 43]
MESPERSQNRALLVLNESDKTYNWQSKLHQAGWNYFIANDLKSARHYIEQNKAVVALVFLSEGNYRRTFSCIEKLKQQFNALRLFAVIESEDLLEKPSSNKIPLLFNDFFHPPLDYQQLIYELGHAHGIAQLAVSHLSTNSCSDSLELVGETQAIKELRSVLVKIAKCDNSVLLNGETGTGKDLCAQLIHNQSHRQNGPFITINCGALPPTLIHSELFGHEKGAFTNADKQYIGHIERADNGTLFLDEIGDLPLDQQVSLLHFLENHKIERIGGHKLIDVNCRVIFATHVDLEQAIHEGRFREDLYHRINVLQLTIPSLRERPQDISLLAKFFLAQYSEQTDNYRFSKDTINAMTEYSWPGNVRELANRVQRALIMADTKIIIVDDLGIKAQHSPSNNVRLLRQRADIDGDTLINAMRDNNHNISAAARQLKISRTTFYRLLKRCNIQLSTVK